MWPPTAPSLSCRAVFPRRLIAALLWPTSVVSMPPLRRYVSAQTFLLCPKSPHTDTQVTYTRPPPLQASDPTFLRFYLIPLCHHPSLILPPLIRTYPSLLVSSTILSSKSRHTSLLNAAIFESRRFKIDHPILRFLPHLASSIPHNSHLLTSFTCLSRQ